VHNVSTEGRLVSLRLAEDRRLAPNAAAQLRQSLPADVRIWLALINHDRVVVSIRKADTDETFRRLVATLGALAPLPLVEEAKRHQRRMHLAARR